MKFVFSEQAWADYFYRQTQDKKTPERINTLINSKTAPC
ncbi:type II toxin-antitoxin system YoeB family toxin [Methylocystis suflitae]|nr:type II toxin-antitoxin system YoeB family toxin [Methylocystis suflitae]MCQ4189508.1 type II toxin-antitoxin system YoeB family toxin [Methylocystis suflitae]